MQIFEDPLTTPLNPTWWLTDTTSLQINACLPG